MSQCWMLNFNGGRYVDNLEVRVIQCEGMMGMIVGVYENGRLILWYLTKQYRNRMLAPVS